MVAQVAKRRLDESWREAVARRARGTALEEDCLRVYDRARADGLGEAEAAFRALSGSGLLWTVDIPGDPLPTRELGE